jgi:hypothetical protein
MRTALDPLVALMRPPQSPAAVIGAALLLPMVVCGGLLSVSVLGCGGDSMSDIVGSQGSGGDASEEGPAGFDAAFDTANADAGPDARDALVGADRSADTGTAADHSSTDVITDGPIADQIAPEASCVTDLIVLARAGTTSSCSFPVPTSVDHDRVNLLIGGRLCEQGSHNCTSRGGWFWIGDEVALCDETCLAWENSGGNLLLEVGCSSESCYQACSNAGGVCANGINNCCVGTRCTNGTCVACVRGGENCASTGECCSGSCQGGICIDGLGGTCVSQAGCSAGVCRDNRCQCAVDQILCNTGCVSYTDPMNCRGCGNVCPSGRICSVDGCVCDPQTGLPDDCNGVCVNKSNDRTNCGFCYFTCPRLEQVCVSSVCGCPGGLTDCNGNCVDTQTNPFNCGTCNHGCPVGVEVCSAGICECAPGYTRCPPGNCVNFLTDKFNCNGCGLACNGNRTCKNGSCG